MCQTLIEKFPWRSKVHIWTDVLINTNTLLYWCLSDVLNCVSYSSSRVSQSQGVPDGDSNIEKAQTQTSHHTFCRLHKLHPLLHHHRAYGKRQPAQFPPRLVKSTKTISLLFDVNPVNMKVFIFLTFLNVYCNLSLMLIICDHVHV